MTQCFGDKFIESEFKEKTSLLNFMLISGCVQYLEILRGSSYFLLLNIVAFTFACGIYFTTSSFP